MNLQLDAFGIVSLILILVIFSVFIFFYILVWKTEEVPLTHKILYGGLFVPITFYLFFGILFQFVEDHALSFLIYVLIAGQILIIMISDSSGDETVRKLRFGRFFLYSIGFAIGLFAFFVLYFLVFIFVIVFGISHISTWHVDRMVLVMIVGIIIFLFSLWGFSKEEKYGTEGKMKGTALFWATMVLWAFSLVTIMLGLFTVIDLIFFQQYGHYLIINIEIFPDYNFLAGASYFPIGIVLFILSWRKIRRDHRYRKQFY